jgi:undecaprenyl-diphosphatase
MKWAPLCTGALAILLFAWLASRIVDGGAPRFDATVREAVYQHASPPLTIAMRGFSFIGEPAFLLPVGFLIVAAPLRGGRARMVVLFLVTVGGAELLEQALKFGFHRAHPAPFFGLAQPGGYSFPSGHALVSLCFFSVVAYVAARHTSSRLVRSTAWAAAALVSALIGLSRIYLGVHYPSDVLAGFAAGVCWLSGPFWLLAPGS